jgi:hypothetical protein
VSTNGKRKPPRPRITLVAGNPSAEEGAAIIAALQLFLEQGAAQAAAIAEPGRWQRAALLEGVSRDPGATRWGASPGAQARPQAD